jgi:RNA 2',3'-cyclic 3'-phosphodiesterase
MPLRASSRQRLFLALWPPPPVLGRLNEAMATLCAECGGRTTPKENQHVTVLFLGNVVAARIDSMQQIMRATAREGFELQLDRIEYRRRGGMVWARATSVPASLTSLVQRLRAALSVAGFSVQARGFIPHITLCRGARVPERLPQWVPTAWRVHELTLVRSILYRNGARYEVIFRTPLAG